MGGSAINSGAIITLFPSISLVVKYCLLVHPIGLASTVPGREKERGKGKMSRKEGEREGERRGEKRRDREREREDRGRERNERGSTHNHN